MGRTAVRPKHSSVAARQRAGTASADARLLPLEQSTSQSDKESSAPEGRVAARLGGTASVATANEQIFVPVGTVGEPQVGKDCYAPIAGHRPATGGTGSRRMLSGAGKAVLLGGIDG